MTDTLPKPRPELADLPKPIAFPDATFTKLFPALTENSIARPHPPRATISNWLHLRDFPVTSCRVELADWLVDWIRDNMLPVDYDTIYFTATNRGDGWTLISAQYNQIIGSRWLALVRTVSVNRVLSGSRHILERAP